MGRKRDSISSVAAALCSAGCEPLDLEICVDSNLKMIQQFASCGTQCSATEDEPSGLHILLTPLPHPLSLSFSFLSPFSSSFFSPLKKKSKRRRLGVRVSESNDTDSLLLLSSLFAKVYLDHFSKGISICWDNAVIVIACWCVRASDESYRAVVCPISNLWSYYL